MTKKFIINCHPEKKSFCHSLFEEYVKGAQSAGHEVKTMRLSEMQFDSDLANYQLGDELEPGLVEFQQNLSWSEHAVFIFPLWWGFVPAKMKGLIDRSFLPDYAYKYVENSSLPKKLLDGRSAEIIMTSDTPGWIMSLIYKAAVFKILKNQILGFSGFKPIKFHMLSPIRQSSEKKRNKWLETAQKLGRKSA